MLEWELEKTCDCDYCMVRGNGRKNYHAWAFFFFLKSKGDNPSIGVFGDKIIIRIQTKLETPV